MELSQKIVGCFRSLNRIQPSGRAKELVVTSNGANTLLWGRQLKRRFQMSIEKLEEIKNDYINRNIIYNGNYEIGCFMITTIDILKDLTQEKQNIYKELAQKEDAIDVNDIKEVKNLNG